MKELILWQKPFIGKFEFLGNWCVSIKQIKIPNSNLRNMINSSKVFGWLLPYKSAIFIEIVIPEPLEVEPCF